MIDQVVLDASRRWQAKARHKRLALVGPIRCGKSYRDGPYMSIRNDDPSCWLPEDHDGRCGGQDVLAAYRSNGDPLRGYRENDDAYKKALESTGRWSLPTLDEMIAKEDLNRQRCDAWRERGGQ